MEFICNIPDLGAEIAIGCIVYSKIFETQFHPIIVLHRLFE